VFRSFGAFGHGDYANVPNDVRSVRCVRRELKQHQPGQRCVTEAAGTHRHFTANFFDDIGSKELLSGSFRSIGDRMTA
jgi:hypothetical protein